MGSYSPERPKYVAWGCCWVCCCCWMFRWYYQLRLVYPLCHFLDKRNLVLKIPWDLQLWTKCCSLAVDRYVCWRDHITPVLQELIGSKLVFVPNSKCWLGPSKDSMDWDQKTPKTVLSSFIPSLIENCQESFWVLQQAEARLLNTRTRAFLAVV